MKITRYLALAAIGIAVAACGKKDEPAKPAPAPTPPAKTQAPSTAPAGVSVSSVNVGKAIGPDKKVTAATTEFAKNDTMYASVETTGSGNATLGAKWTWSGGGKTTVVKEDSMTINASGPATNEFHVSKPDGWPAGEYTVDVTIDGKPAGSKKVTVK